jgi:hypothetical protein
VRLLEHVPVPSRRYDHPAAVRVPFPRRPAEGDAPFARVPGKGNLRADMESAVIPPFAAAGFPAAVRRRTIRPVGGVDRTGVAS